MKAIDFDLVSPVHLFKALKTLKLRRSSDLFPEQEGIRQAAHRLESESDASERVRALLDTSRRFRCDELVPKGNGVFRLATYFDAYTEVASLAVAMEVSEVLDAYRPPKSEQRAFSYRIDPDGPEWFDSAIGFTEFRERCHELATSAGHVMEADVANFYHSIRAHHVLNEEAMSGLSPRLSEALRQLVGAFDVERRGLPVGGDAARLLAEFALLPVDAELASIGMVYARFVDDFRLFFHDTPSMNMQGFRFQEVLMRRGFFLNKSKLSTFKARDFLDHESEKSGLQVQTKSGETSVSTEHFDPYSELVHSKVEALKATLNRFSVREALAFEFEKVIPSFPNLKVLLAGVPLLDRESALECLQLVCASLDAEVVHPVLPHIHRMIERMQDNGMLKNGHRASARLLTELLSRHSETWSPYAKGMCLRLFSVLSAEAMGGDQEWLQSMARMESSEFVQRELKRPAGMGGTGVWLTKGRAT